MSINFIAVGTLSYNPLGAYATSADGITWTERTHSGFDSKTVFGIAHNGYMWVAGTSNNYVAYSYDGINWTQSTSGTSIITSVGGIACSPVTGRFVMGGVGPNFSIAYSDDGINWTGCASNKFLLGGSSAGGSSFAYCVRYVNGYFIAGAQAGPGANGRTIGYSTNGIDWILTPVTKFSTLVSDIVYNGTYYIISGSPEDIQYTTVDPPSWQNSSFSGGSWWTGGITRTVGCDTSGVVIAAGQTGTYIVRSTDNMVSSASVGNSNFNQFKFALHYRNGLWLLGQGFTVSTILYSTDMGASWTASSYTTNNNAVRNFASPIVVNWSAPPTITSAVVTNYTKFTVTLTPPVYFGNGATSITSYLYSIDGGTTYIDSSQNTTTLILENPIKTPTSILINLLIKAKNNNGYISAGAASFSVTIPPYPCFLKSTKILTNRGYKRIENLHVGDLVKTVLHGFKPVWKLGKRQIHHPASEERIKHQLYVCSSDIYPEVFEDLVVTGCHSILVKEWSSESEKERAIEANGGNVYITDDYYRLPACADERTRVYDQEGDYTIYHVALEHDNYYMNYGIYANGLLVESCSKRYLNELSGMETT